MIKTGKPQVIDTFGQTLTGVLGDKQFQAHNAIQSWDDGGVAEDLAKQLRTTIADQVKQAVGEYVADGRFEFVMAGDRILMAFHVANDLAYLKPYVDPIELLESAIADAEKDEHGHKFFANVLDLFARLNLIVQRKHNSFRAKAGLEPVVMETTIRPAGRPPGKAAAKAQREPISDLSAVDFDAIANERPKRT